ncbi:class I SAM-dependent DNA methyltransferase [Falsihalocynthiibacter sp. SS001]|uniref:class I SAM-dependent DNA methyltransferase n=1 Tax=Falsihalocynthiibacter sp. SS001 TaxID=3349698 RepID=UPI0036D2407D
MKADPQTLAVYEKRVGDYAKMVAKDTPFPALEAFISALQKGAEVLDLGCGTGRAAARMAAAGLNVTAWDASPAMAAFAKENFGIDVRLATFGDLDSVDAYDGVWANFSLLHAPKSAFGDHLAAIHKALRKGGKFHLGLKTGDTEMRDDIGRFYALYTEAELEDYLSTAGFQITSRSFGEDPGLDGTISPWIIISAHA